MISILKWLLFAVEIVVLGIFFLITFFAPVISGVSKIPTVAALAAGSLVPSLASAICFAWMADGRSRFRKMLTAPPMIVCGLVIGLSAIPLLIGWVTANGMK
jgi:hypothetical protein